jgi:hypothetical protein
VSSTVRATKPLSGFFPETPLSSTSETATSNAIESVGSVVHTLDMAIGGSVLTSSVLWPVSRLLLVILVALAPNAAIAQRLGGDVTDELSKACHQAMDADNAETDLALHHRSSELDTALQSESAFWNLLTDPSTAYLDRMAAAHQGGSRVSLDQLPRLWRAYAAFKVLPSGVNPSPCRFSNLNSWAAMWPSAWERRREVPLPGTVSPRPESRTVVGFEVRLPVKAVDYPLNQDDRRRSPWLWQMERALSILVENVRKYYEQPERYESMAEVGLRWHTDDFYEKGIRDTFLQRGPRNAAWVRVQMRLALEHQTGAGVLYAYGNDSFHLEELMHVAHIIILQQTSNAGIAAGSAGMLARMAKTDLGRPPSPFWWKPLQSATGMLSAARWAMNRDLDVHSRYYLVADSICSILKDPPFTPNFQVRPNSPEEADSLAKFEAWFAREKRGLELQAANENPPLNELAAELGAHVEVPIIPPLGSSDWRK